MSSVSRSNSLLGAVGEISLFKGVMAASSARPEYVLSSNVEESACGDVYLHLIFQNLKHVPKKGNYKVMAQPVKEDLSPLLVNKLLSKCLLVLKQQQQ